MKTLRTSKQTPAGASGRSAYTIIETIVAVAVAGVLFSACLAGFSYGFSGVQADRENSRAVQILLEKMELVRLYNWAQITRADTNTYLPNTFTAPFYPNASNNGGFDYIGTVTITNAAIPVAYSNDLKTISVAVTWTSGKVTHSRSMSTFVSQYGLQNYIY